MHFIIFCLYAPKQVEYIPDVYFIRFRPSSISELCLSYCHNSFRYCYNNVIHSKWEWSFLHHNFLIYWKPLKSWWCHKCVGFCTTQTFSYTCRMRFVGRSISAVLQCFIIMLLCQTFDLYQNNCIHITISITLQLMQISCANASSGSKG